MAGGVRTLADGNTKLTILITRPANLDAITLTELQAGIEASC
ncbi:phage tail tube protein, partial [Clostridioides difficile]